METKAKQLTLFEAACLIAGIGIGGGIMAVPFLASLNGIGTLIAVMVAAYFLSLLLHLMIAETFLRDGGTRQLLELFSKYVFRGRSNAALTWLFFTLLALGFISNLAGYVAGCGETLAALTGVPLRGGHLLTYAVAAGVVFFGLKAIGISEKIAITGMGVLFIALGIGTAGADFKPLPVAIGGPKEVIALYGMVMFGFACFFSIPQAVEGLQYNRRLVPWSVALGILINFVLVLVISLLSMLVSDEVTEIATLGWGESIGQWALAAGSVFTLLAMLTSYWAVSYAMAVIVMEQLKLNYRLAWLIATLPSLVLTLTGVTGFLGFMRITGGAIAVMLAVMVVPALRNCRALHPDAEPGFDIGVFGGIVFQLIVVAAYILMAAGSVVPVR